MNKRTEKFVWALAAVAVLVMITLFFAPYAQAGGNNNSDTVINNYYPEGGDSSTTLITSGMSDEEQAKGLAMAASAGSHQLDFSTQQWQGSITGAWYDDQDAVSFAVGKRWEKFGNALFHGSYTQNGSEDLFVFGGTFRF